MAPRTPRAKTERRTRRPKGGAEKAPGGDKNSRRGGGRKSDDSDKSESDGAGETETGGLSYEDIAEVMNCPAGTVRSRIFRARESVAGKIRPLLDKQTGKRW